ncbi:hypothetical protein Tco_1100959 [Tanacetum coccineum]
MSQDVLLTVMNYVSLIGETMNLDGNRKESCNLEAELLKSQNAFNDLLKRHSQLKKHCISLECSIKLNQEIFQKRESCDNQIALEIPEFFEKNDLKAQLQDKDSTICKLKDMIKSMREKSKDENVKYDYCEIKTKNVELENKQSDSLIDKLNLKSAENEDLKAQIQDKVFVITSLKNDLRKIKRKEIVDIAAQIPSASTIVSGMFKLDLEPLAPSAKKVVVTPKNKVKKVRFVEPLISSRNSKQVESSKTSDSNTPALSSTGLKCSTSKSGSKPIGNKRNDRISQTPSRNMKNKNSKLNANSDLNCATCKKSLFDDVHDKCLLDFVKNVVQIVLWYLDSGCSKHMTGNRSQLMNFVSKFLGTVRFGNDHIARIMGYGDYQLGNVTISRVYYIEGL